MAAETEARPFIKYSDDPELTEVKPESIFRPTKDRRSRIISYAIVSAGTSLLWLLVLAAIYSPFPIRYSPSGTPEARQNITSNAHLIDCGNTTQQARARNCKYDVLLNNWVPAPCFDADFIAEYTDDASWAAYADANMTEKLESVEDMSEREFYFTSVRDHINHCAVMWKKQFAVLFEERPAFDAIIANPGHTEHCAQYLMDITESGWTKATKVDRGFAGCWIRD